MGFFYIKYFYYLCNVVSDRLKDIVFKKLYKELSKVEIIPYKDSVYFIDRDNEYWYFEYEKKGKLWWRYNFFLNFFVLFSLEPHEYEKVMGEWVEEVINCKVNTTSFWFFLGINSVEEVLNCKVNTTTKYHGQQEQQVKEALNCKVITTVCESVGNSLMVEKVLNCKVITTLVDLREKFRPVEESLNCRVITTTDAAAVCVYPTVEEVLNHKVDVTMARITDRSTEVEEVLNLEPIL